MAQIYSNAYITILASNAGDAAQGFLAHCIEYEAPNARIPFRIAPNRFGSITARLRSSHSPYAMSACPLSTRAWALQEQMMAVRILAYTNHTLEWRCASSMMSLNNSLNVHLSFNQTPKLISQISKDPEETLWEWVRIVVDYSRRSMSLPSDKLPAIAALAERFAPVLGHYYAGLWQYDLIRQLSWISHQPSQRQCAGNPYRAPSWSWASVDEIWPQLNEGDEDCCTFVSAVVLLKNAHVPYGEVRHASVKICGRVCIARVPNATGKIDRMCTLFHNESEVAEPPLQQFYKTYFHQDTKGAVPSRISAFNLSRSWDHEEDISDPLVVREFLPTLTTTGK